MSRPDRVDFSDFKSRGDLSAEHVRELFSYNPFTGRLYWLRPLANATRKGSPAGTVNKKGYISVMILGLQWQHHRLVWMWFNGPLSASVLVDHINRVPGDDRISNLRLATKTQNVLNAKVRADNTSGYRGVRYCKRLGKWEATLNMRGVRRYLGCFNSAEEAYAKYIEATTKHRGNDAVFVPL